MRWPCGYNEASKRCIRLECHGTSPCEGFDDTKVRKPHDFEVRCPHCHRLPQPLLNPKDEEIARLRAENAALRQRAEAAEGERSALMARLLTEENRSKAAEAQVAVLRDALRKAERELDHCSTLPGGRGADDLLPGVREALSTPPAAVEPDALSDLVARFSVALLDKLRAAQEKYGYTDAWLNDGWRDDLCKDMRHHLKKGDPRDVAAYCAFAWHHGWSLSATIPSAVERVIEAPDGDDK